MKYYQIKKRDRYKMKQDLKASKAIQVIIQKISLKLTHSKCSRPFSATWVDPEDHAQILSSQSLLDSLDLHSNPVQEYSQLGLSKTIMMNLMNKQTMIQINLGLNQNVLIVIVILKQIVIQNLRMSIKNRFILVMQMKRINQRIIKRMQII